MQRELRVEATPDVRRAIAAMGRTEDVKFWPSGRTLAVAGYGRHQLFLVDFTADHRRDETVVRLDHVVELSGKHLRQPHGIAFIDEHLLAVANRDGDVVVWRLSRPKRQPSTIDAYVVATIPTDGVDLRMPGSLTSVRLAPDLHELLVCDNESDVVTRHVLDTRACDRVVASRVFLRAGLATPDGVAVSSDGRWIAISNHGTHSVLMFENDGELGETSKARGELAGVNYPHGVRFATNDTRLLVADAGAPMLHVFACGDDGWSGYREPCASIRVFDDETYLRQRTNPAEGGPKGVDIDERSKLVAYSCEERPLELMALSAVLGPGDCCEAPPADPPAAGAPAAGAPAAGSEYVRVALLREIEAVRTLEATAESLEATASSLEHDLAAARADERSAGGTARLAQAELRAICASRSWRLTGPMRWVVDTLRRGARRRGRPRPGSHIRT